MIHWLLFLLIWPNPPAVGPEPIMPVNHSYPHAHGGPVRLAGAL